MSSLTRTLCEGVVSLINSATLSQTVSAEYRLRPRSDLPALQNCRVTVCPKPDGLSVSNASRGAEQVDFGIYVGVQRRVDPEDQDEVEAMLGLVEEVASALRRAQVGGAFCVSVSSAPLYSVEHLDRFQVFTAVLTATFRLTRAA